MLTKERVSDRLLDAVKRSIGEHGNELAGLLCVGEVCREFKKAVQDRNCCEFVQYAGTVSPWELKGYYEKSACLLVVEAEMDKSYFLPSKFADYCLTGIPILAVTPAASSIRDYLEEFGEKNFQIS